MYSIESIYEYYTDYNSDKYYPNSVHLDKYGNKIIVLGKSKYQYSRLVVKFEGLDLFFITDDFTLKNKRFNSKLHKKFYGIGYLGYGVFKTNGSRYELIRYTKWKSMLNRCYGDFDSNPSYSTCKVCEEWHNYQNYAKWYDENYIEGYHLDKDLLQQGAENKIYSPETCCFIPNYINLFLQDKNTISKGKTGIVGVTFSNSSGKNKYRASINIDGKNTYLGEFDNIEEAEKCYKEAYSLKLEIINNQLETLGLPKIKNKLK